MNVLKNLNFWTWDHIRTTWDSDCSDWAIRVCGSILAFHVQRGGAKQDLGDKLELEGVMAHLKLSKARHRMITKFTSNDNLVREYSQIGSMLMSTVTDNFSLECDTLQGGLSRSTFFSIAY